MTAVWPWVSSRQERSTAAAPHLPFPLPPPRRLLNSAVRSSISRSLSCSSLAVISYAMKGRVALGRSCGEAVGIGCGGGGTETLIQRVQRHQYPMMRDSGGRDRCCFRALFGCDIDTQECCAHNVSCLSRRQSNDAKRRRRPTTPMSDRQADRSQADKQRTSTRQQLKQTCVSLPSSFFLAGCIGLPVSGPIDLQS